MKIPATKDSVVIRTDFSDESAWQSIVAAMQEPQGDFRAYLDFVSDRAFSGLTGDQLSAIPSEDPHRSFIFVVDHVALSHPEHPVLAVSLCDKPGRSFRVIPSEVWGVENNLSIGNMDFDEFADAANSDGVFRGFSEAQQ